VDPTASAQPTPMCATHEGAQSTGTCARCGNFVCPLCLDALSALPDHCEDCREREGGGRILWERPEEGSWLSRWWRTCRDVILHPTRTFEDARPGSLGSAATFTVVTGGFLGVCAAALVGCLLGAVVLLMGAEGTLPGGGLDGEAGAFGLLGIACIVVAYIVIIPAVLVVMSLVRGTVFHLTAMAMGGEASYADSLWASFYLHGVYLLQLPLGVVQQIPLIGPMIALLALLAYEVYFAVQFTTVANRYHRLEGGRATFAGWSVFLFAVLTGCLLCVLGYAWFASMGLDRTL